MPANPAVTIQAALASNPAITASYALTLGQSLARVELSESDSPGPGRNGLNGLDRDRLCAWNGPDHQAQARSRRLIIRPPASPRKSLFPQAPRAISR